MDIDTNLPLFEYGLFKPGQPAFCIIKNDIKNILNNFIISGEIWEIKHFPVLDYKGFKEIQGNLIFFKNEYSYKRLQNIIPNSIYDIKVISVKDKLTGLFQKANVLVSASEELIKTPYYLTLWEIQTQPLFQEGLSLVKDIIESNSNITYDLKKLFLIKLGYIHLFEIIERFICLTYIFLDATFENISIIANEEIFKEQLKKNVFENRILNYDNKNILILNPSNPLESFRYYYFLKSYNFSKNDSNFSEFNHYKSAINELYDFFVHFKFKKLQNAITEEKK